MQINVPLIIFLFAGMLLSVLFKKLTALAALTGGICGWLVYAGGGYNGLAIMTLFFVAGTLATMHKAHVKQSFEAAGNHQRRNSGQVLANAGVAALIGLISLFTKGHAIFFEILIAASFSAAMADTWSSELGTVYGCRFYNILTLKPDQRGLDGVVSFEGTLLGLVGSIMIAAIYSYTHGWGTQAAIIIIAGTVGNLTDSFLGAAFERKNIIKNDTVNFLNTLVGAGLAGILWLLLM